MAEIDELLRKYLDDKGSGAADGTSSTPISLQIAGREVRANNAKELEFALNNMVNIYDQALRERDQALQGLYAEYKALKERGDASREPSAERKAEQETGADNNKEEFFKSLVNDPKKAVKEAVEDELSKANREIENLKKQVSVQSFQQTHPLYSTPQAIRVLDEIRTRMGWEPTVHNYEAALILGQKMGILPDPSAATPPPAASAVPGAGQAGLPSREPNTNQAFSGSGYFMPATYTGTPTPAPPPALTPAAHQPSDSLDNLVRLADSMSLDDLKKSIELLSKRQLR
ncbi:MAG: hypothetical protein V2G41_09580 [bacterium JZ-2024 1]